MELETVNKLYLELSQVATATTAKELKLIALLSECRSDIFQTARTNQTNLTGLDIITPEDPPIPARIDKCKVNQRGIDESLELVKRIEKTLREVDPKPTRRTA